MPYGVILFGRYRAGCYRVERKSEEMMGEDAVVVKKYKTTKKYQSDARKMTGRGYRVESTMMEKQSQSCLRWIFLGFLVRPKPLTVVTYCKMGNTG